MVEGQIVYRKESKDVNSTDQDLVARGKMSQTRLHMLRTPKERREL